MYPGGRSVGLILVAYDSLVILSRFLQAGFSHLHIHDNNGKKDTHSPVGEGDINFIPVMAAMRRTGASAVIEVKSFEGVKKSIRALEKM